MLNRIYKLLLPALKVGIFDTTFQITFGVTALLWFFALVVFFVGNLVSFPIQIPFLIVTCLLAPALTIMAFYYGIWRASTILKNWYESDADFAYDVVLSHIFGTAEPLLKASHGNLELISSNPVSDEVEPLENYFRMVNLGIPSLLTLDADTAVLTELNGKPHGVYYEAGKHQLMPFEKIREIFDLRDRTASFDGADALTLDGIRIELKGMAGFRISRLSEEMSVEDPYPVDPDALFKVAYKRSVGQSGGRPAKLDVVVAGMVKSAVRDVVANYRFSQLFERTLENEDAKALADLGKEVVERANKSANALGLTIRFVGLDWQGIPDDVLAQARANWKRTREQEIEQHLSKIEAEIFEEQIDTIIKTLRDNGFKSDKLAEIRGMLEDTVSVRRYTKILIGGEEDLYPYDPYYGRGRSTSGKRKSPSRSRYRDPYLDKVIRELENGSPDETEQILDRLTASQFPGLARTDDEDQP